MGEPWLESLPHSGTVSIGKHSELVMWAHPTDASDGGASGWPTPATRDWKGGSGTLVEKNGKLVRRSDTTGTEYGARLDAVTEHWPTPRTQMTRRIQIREDGYHSNLEEAVAMMDNWPTPTANEDAAGLPIGKMQRMLGNHPKLRAITEQSQFGPQAPMTQTDGSGSSESDQTSPQPSPKRLNPSFVEWLMGLPIGHSDSKSWGTESFRRWLQQHGI